jgi:23S rRNA A2030 N6-methylase RlmJ
MEYRPGSGWVFIDAPYDISQYFYIKVRGTNAQYIRAKEAASTVTYQLWNPFTNEVKAKRIAHKNNDQAYDDTTISFQYLGDHIAATLSLYISQVSSRDLIEIGKAQDFVTDPGADLIYTKTTDLEVDEE